MLSSFDAICASRHDVGDKITDAHFRYGHNLFGDHLRDKGVLWNIKGPLFTGEPGLTRQRWDFWRSRLQAMESSGATRETKQVALAAVQAMSHVETSQL